MITKSELKRIKELASSPDLHHPEDNKIADKAAAEMNYWLTADTVLDMVSACEWYDTLIDMMNKAIIVEIADEISANEPEVKTPEQANLFRYTCRMVAAASAMRALEAAASICEGVNSHDNPMTAQDCADYIRALIGVRDDY